MADDGIALGIITWGEICEGLLARPDPERHLATLGEFVADIELITLDTLIARRYAQVRLRLRAQGQMIPDNDLWIAATALAYDLTLVSRDRHFERIPDLKLYKEK